MDTSTRRPIVDLTEGEARHKLPLKWGVPDGVIPAWVAEMDYAEVFGGQSTFTSTIDGCESGTVSTAAARIGGGPGTSFGTFNGFKIFECTDGGVFVVRLQAKFTDEGSTGTWAIVGGQDGFEDLHGAGTLVGTPTGTGINDVYDGTARSPVARSGRANPKTDAVRPP